MTKALEQAFRKASRLPAAEQDALAEAIRNEILAEEEWEDSFAASQEELGKLADEALAELRSGKTRPIKLGKR